MGRIGGPQLEREEGLSLVILSGQLHPLMILAGIYWCYLVYWSLRKKSHYRILSGQYFSPFGRKLINFSKCPAYRLKHF